MAATRFVRLVAVVTLAAVVTAACTSDPEDPISDRDSGGDSPASQLTVTVASTRADMVTGGDALLEVTGVADGDAIEAVTVDGSETQVEFRQGPGGRLVGLLEGLGEGESTVTVRAGDEHAEVVVTNHPRSGPVFSGQRLPMVRCTTDRYGMEPSEPPGCDAPGVSRYAYVDDEAGMHFLEGDPFEPGVMPDDAATVHLGDSETPAVLLVESRVIDRGVSTITTLVTDPSTVAPVVGDGVDGGADREGADGDAGGPRWDRDHWNGRLVYRFGGGCGSTYSQGFNFFDAPNLELLADGYAFATNTLNTFQVQCQDIVSAEAAMMTKEYFAENYGLPEVTIGEGGSGGAIQQLLVAQNYPGILDAIVPSLPFPDAMSIAPGVVDCALLGNYYATDAGARLSTAQRTAVNGHRSPLTCVMWQQTFVPMVDPAECGFGEAAGSAVSSLPGLSEGLPTVPEELRYDPGTNPGGLRCTLQDSYPQILEADPDTGFVERPLDNTGVQYGLAALNDGVLDLEEFLALNEGVGGFDLDAEPVPERMVADEAMLEPLYASGRITAGGPLLDIPIIAIDVYTDDEGDIHDRFRVFSIGERLGGPDGSGAPGYVIWTQPPGPDGDLVQQLSGAVDVGAEATRVVDEWATALAGSDAVTTAEALAATRPAAAVDTCFDAAGAVVDSGDDIYAGPGPCTDPYPVGGDPRTAAGAPMANDIVKCALQSVTDAVAADVYDLDLTDSDIARLEAVFPEGVCDWTSAGVGQLPLGDPWQSY